jgi:branched-chain amino acid transport system substrate-binding protein
VEEAGGKVLGSTSYPFPGTTDFSAYLLEAQASGANVIAFANAGTDLSNCVKQAQEFGLVRKGVWLAALIGTIVQVQALGLDAAQGLLMTETFYWDLNDRTRSLMARLKPKLPANTVPNLAQAGAYSGTINYLRAADRVGLAQAKASGRAMIDAMKAQPTDDDAFGACEVRVDGRFICPAYLFQVKSPSESRGPGDVFKLVATTPSDQAFRPLSEGGCPLVR